MPQKRYRPEEIIAKLRQADVLLGEGKKVPEVVKAFAIHEVTYYRWRNEYGGLRVSQAKRLKELERENARLRGAVSDLTLDRLILQEASRGTSELLAPPPLRGGSL
jgi:putative transposase